MKWILPSLITLLSIQAHAMEKVDYVLPDGSKVKVVLNSVEEASVAALGTGNCFGLATHSKRAQPGASNSIDALRDETGGLSKLKIHQALVADGGIPIQVREDVLRLDKTGSATSKRILPLSGEYYLIAAMTQGTDEYHFVRLYDKGWGGTPSKVSSEFVISPGSFPKVINGALEEPKDHTQSAPVKWGHFKYNFLGYYLYPVKVIRKNQSNASCGK